MMLASSFERVIGIEQESPQLKWLHFENIFWISQKISPLIWIDPYVYFILFLKLVYV